MSKIYTITVALLIITANIFESCAQENACEKVAFKDRINCMPVKNIDPEQCSNLQCCWDDTIPALEDTVIPKCFFPRNSVRYQLLYKVESKFGIDSVFRLISPSGFPDDVRIIKIAISYCDSQRLRIKITDVHDKRFEVPLRISDHCKSEADPSSWYDVTLSDDGLLQIGRKSSGIKVFSVDIAKMIFADQFLQMSINLPSSFVYGLGEHMGSLLRDMNWTKYTFFNRDEIPKKDMNLYSSFPFYMVMEADYKSHGVYFFNSNAMDVILQPSPAVTFRSIGGIFDMFLFMGPSPDEVVQQFVHLTGLPMMPPYWSLGFHLCRLGYFTLNHTMEVLENTVAAGIPLDTQWNDIDCMDRYNDFTYDSENFKGLPDFVEKLHQRGMHYALIVDPGISSAEPAGTYPPFDEGLAMDIFIKNASGQLLETKVWNKVSSVFPDFTNRKATEYWGKQLSDFHSRVPFDGVWLDMNEPTNFLNGSFCGCPTNSSLEKPPYTPGIDPLRTKTICMTAKHNVSEHYNIHNIYGTFETAATYNSMKKILGKRPFVLTRAGFPGIGQYAAMWNGDVISLWEHMRASIPSILSYSMAGVSMIGADICGFNDNTTVELCARWFALGAFYPFCRNHNSDENIAQDPVSLGPSVVAAAKFSLSVRYFLLPYLYTLMYRSHKFGETVARPLFFEYPQNQASYSVDTQFLWGEALMIIPALYPGMQNINAYFPPDIWYDFYTGHQFQSSGQYFTLDAPLEKINLAVRSGYVIPAQQPETTTSKSRLNKFVLLVALDSRGKAKGQLYWDDGESVDVLTRNSFNLIKFTAKKSGLSSSFLNRSYKTEMILGEIKVYGMEKGPDNVTVNGNSADFEYDALHKVLLVQNLSVNLLKSLVITW